ncbi:hypothetical protein [Kineococcus arenarius]|uniref:hypothetical protein n=1 Tax=unclassified Kineococcus TaxID=2621656 RepID=UPI003D7DA9C0
MARVHVTCWQQTYRGLVPDSVLDDPGLLEARERSWTGALTDERWSSNRAAVAELGGTVVGIAMSGPAQEDGVRAVRWVRRTSSVAGSGGHRAPPPGAGLKEDR